MHCTVTEMTERQNFGIWRNYSFARCMFYTIAICSPAGFDTCRDFCRSGGFNGGVRHSVNDAASGLSKDLNCRQTGSISGDEIGSEIAIYIGERPAGGATPCMVGAMGRQSEIV